MWKLIIADDEPKIRRGLKKVLPWEDLNIQVVGEAEDGRQALDLIHQLKPDILFVDINMPFLNGLDLLEKMKQTLERCVVIVITGHDEFAYAQQALKLKVFDYILKPVVRNQLESVAIKAVETLEKTRQYEERHKWVDHQLKSNSILIRDKFLVKWIDHLMDEDEVRKNLDFFGLQIGPNIGIVLLKVMSHLDTGGTHRAWDRELLEFAARNVAEDVVRYESAIVFNDTKGHIIVLVTMAEAADWPALGEKIQQRLETILEKVVLLDQCTVDEIAGVPAAYRKLADELTTKGSLSPVVVLAKKFIDRNYHQPDLSLSEVADGVQVSPAYLSKQLKRELGLSFIDYLTKVRIQKAIQFMNDPAAKVYEIAEMVGYSSQHYFSNTFKKVTGTTPLIYRKGQR
ncbi:MULTISPECIES: response regulator transcription factor [Paenibacillus]|uniref:response regulator transcription factor n=1 Tax=Paenibacillus TaxID=44249 RepID=UPI001357E0EB|nr:MULTISPECIES: response regulator [Paenibacillus]